jgi:hypothetical protein
MFKPKAALLVSVLVFIGTLLPETEAHAEPGQATTAPQKRFEISFGGGWGLYRMTEINKHYLDDFARGLGFFDDHIDNGLTIFGEVGYFLSPKVSVDVGLMHLQGETEKEDLSYRNDEYGNVIAVYRWERSLKTRMMAPQFKVRYHLSTEKVDLFVGGGIAWCFGRATLGSIHWPEWGEVEPLPPSEHWRFTARGLGLLASAGASLVPTGASSLGAEIGYRYLTTGDLKDKDGNAWKAGSAGTAHRMDLDFSGLFILGRFSLRL